MSDEGRQMKLEDRLIELLGWGFNPQVEAARPKMLNGEIIAVYGGGDIEYIYGKRHCIPINRPSGEMDADFTMYKFLEYEVGMERVDETLAKYKGKVEVEWHYLYNGARNIVYKIQLPSRAFMKVLNPYFPEHFREAEKISEESESSDEELVDEGHETKGTVTIKKRTTSHSKRISKESE